MTLIKSKKFLLGICFFGLFISNSFGQVLNDYRTRASGLWSDFATVWERHNGTAWVAATASPTNTANIVSILSTHSVTIAGATTVDQLTVANGGAIVINSAITLTIANGATDLTVSSGGTITNNGTLTLNLSTASTNSGTIINSGTITTTGTLTHAAGSFYRHSFSSSAATAGVIPTSTWNASSTCEILACGNSGNAPSGLNQAFGHFIWNNTTQPVDINFLGTMSIPTTGNFTLSSTNGFKIVLVSSAAGGATSIGGNFSITNGNITIIKVNNLNKTNQLSITGTYTQSGGTMTIADCAGSLAGNTANGTLTVGSTSTISGGVLNVNTSTWVGAGGNGTYSTGLITLSGTGVLNGCSSSASASSGVSGTITATAGVTVNTGGTLNLNSSTTTGTGGVTILNSGAAFLIAGGTVNLASGTAVASTGCNGTLNVNNGGFTISSGALNLGSSATTTGGGNGILNVASGNFVHSGGTVSKTGLNSGTININGSTAQTIRSGGFTVGNAITFNLSQNTAAAGTTTIATGFTISNGTTFNINDNSLNTNDFTPGMAITNNGAVNLNSNAELDMTTFVMSGTGSFSTFTNSLLTTRHATGISATAALGCIQVSGAKTFASDGNYTYNGTVAQVTGDGLPAILNGGILTINNTVAITTGGVTLSRATTILEGASSTGSLVLTAGRLITTATNLITIGDDVTVGLSSITRFVDGPIKKIGDDIFIFPTGDVYTNSVPALAAKWARIEIAAPASITDEFTAEYHKENDPHNFQVVGLVNGPGIDHVSHKEYWDLTRDAGTSTPQVKLYWADGSVATSIGSAISSTASTDLHIAEFYSGQWNDKGAGALTGTTASGTLFTGIVPDFTTGTIMNFTFSSVTGVNPLPVELLNFTGTQAMNGNQLDWTTATETNNDYFNLERSTNGIEFTNIATVDGNGNSSSINTYTFLDADPFEGINYYRLKQTDYNGDYFYSNIISIQSTNSATVLVYPNPSQDFVTIDISDNFESVRIYNMLGEIVYENSSIQTRFQFNPISNGIYVIKGITTDGKEITTRFIKN